LKIEIGIPTEVRAPAYFSHDGVRDRDSPFVAKQRAVAITSIFHLTFESLERTIELVGFPDI
jgi:hypothetical protein